MLKSIGEDIWAAEGELKSFAGIKMTIRSTVVRLDQGRLMVISPIHPTPEFLDKLKDIGVVQYIVAPNCMHHLYLGKFSSHFPEAQVWGPGDLFHKRKDINFTNSLAVDKPLPWSEQLETVIVKARPPLYEEFVFFHKKTKTLILTDIFFNYQKFNNPIEVLAAWLNGGYKKLTMTRIGRSVFKDSASLQAFVQKVSLWQPENLVLAHGELVIGQAFNRLQRPLKEILR